METVQAMLAAETADAIVGFLYRVHRQDHIARTMPTLRYADNAGFNEYVDNLHEAVRIFNEEFPPSRILFELAPEPYRLYLAEYPPESEVGDEAPSQAEATETTANEQGVPVAALADVPVIDATTTAEPGANEVANG